MDSNKKNKAEAFLAFVENSPKNHVEFYVEGLGWLIVLKENIEIVSDNWFTSTKYNASSYGIHEENTNLLVFKNIYRINPSFIENDNNVKYNLHFNELNVFVDRIIAFH